MTIQGNTSREVKPMNREQELERKMHELLEQAVYDCVIDEAGHKVRRCTKCMSNVGMTVKHEVVCGRELEAEQ